jgi:hypothetical protein
MMTVVPAATMYTNAQYQVIKMTVPEVCAGSIVVATDGEEIVVTADGHDCRYYCRLPQRYRARRERIETQLAGATLEVRIPNPDQPLN